MSATTSISTPAARVAPTAAEIMTPSPQGCSPFSTVAEAALLLRDDGDAIPVVEAGKPVGLLTEREIAVALPDHPDLASLPVSEVMTRPVTVPHDAPLDRIRAEFDAAGVRHLLVVDPDGNLVGIITWADLLRRLPAEQVGQDTSGAPTHAGTEHADTAGAARRHTPRATDRRPWANPRVLWDLFKTAGAEWLGDKAARLGAALAYYTVFSIAPLLLIVIALAGLVFGREAAQGRVVAQLRDLVGPHGAEAIEAMLASASRPEAGYTATGTGAVLLLVGAMGLFGQLQDAMNTVWGVQPKPGRGLWGFIKERLLSLTMVMGTAFLLLVSLVVSAALAAMGGLLGDRAAGAIGPAINFVVSFAVITGLFAMIFRYLPDAKVAWEDVWLGAAVTALLFEIGKLAIGLYLGHSSVASAYGAAGSLVVLLIWTYYSSQIFLYGAELTQVYANRYGSRIVPEPDAEPVTPEARAEQGIPRQNGPGATRG